MKYMNNIEVFLITVPTFMKLQLRKEEAMETIPIFLDSASNVIHSNNTASTFKCSLPNDMAINGKWSVALSSISFRNDFLIMKDLDLGYSIEVYRKNEPVIKQQDEVPLRLRTHSEVIEWFLEEINEFVTNEQAASGQVKLTFKNMTKLVISRNLSMLLGGIMLQDQNQVIKKPKNGVYLMPRMPKPINLFPCQLFLYSSMLEHSLVAGIKLPLLKIVPIPSPINTNNYHNVTFTGDNLRFTPLRFNNVPQLLDFTICSASGSDIGFSNSQSHVFITLLFKRDD